MTMSGPTIVVYEKPTCTTCRKLVRLFQDRGIPFERLDYYVEPLSKRRLGALLKKAGLRPRDVLRARAPEYKELGLADPRVTDAELMDHLVAHPDLLQRPIVERGDRAVLARPVERALEVL
jgi:arsenate reductase